MKKKMKDSTQSQKDQELKKKMEKPEYEVFSNEEASLPDQAYLFDEENTGDDDMHDVDTDDLYEEGDAEYWHDEK